MELKLHTLALDYAGVDTPEELHCFVDEIAPKFSLALVNSNAPDAVCFLPWSHARLAARPSVIIEPDNTTSRKYVVPAWETLSLPWFDMNTGEQCAAPEAVHEAARALDGYTYVDGSHPMWRDWEPRWQPDPATTDSQEPPTSPQLEQIARNLGLVGLGVGTRLTFRGNGEPMPFPAHTTSHVSDHRGTGATSGIAAEDGDAPVSEASFDRGLTWEDPPKRDSRKAKIARARTLHSAGLSKRRRTGARLEALANRSTRQGPDAQEAPDKKLRGVKAQVRVGQNQSSCTTPHSVPPIA